MDGFISTSVTAFASSIGMRLTAYFQPDTRAVVFATLSGFRPDFDPATTTWTGTGAIVSAMGRDGTAMLRGSSMALGTIARLEGRDDHARHSNAVGMTLEELLSHSAYGSNLHGMTVADVIASYSVDES